MSERRSKIVSILAHPMVSVVVSLLGINLAIDDALDYSYAPDFVWKSLISGAAVAIPMLIFMRQDLIKNKNLHVRAAARELSGEDLHEHRSRQFRLGIVLVLGFALIILISSLWQIPSRAGLGMPMILAVALYPQQKAIYEAAKARLEETVE